MQILSSPEPDSGGIPRAFPHSTALKSQPSQIISQCTHPLQVFTYVYSPRAITKKARTMLELKESGANGAAAGLDAVLFTAGKGTEPSVQATALALVEGLLALQALPLHRTCGAVGAG